MRVTGETQAAGNVRFCVAPDTESSDIRVPARRALILRKILLVNGPVRSVRPADASSADIESHGHSYLRGGANGRMGVSHGWNVPRCHTSKPSSHTAAAGV